MFSNRFQKLTALFLLLSGIFGVYILVEDALIGPPQRLLWADNWIWAPVPHATALVVMVLVDFAVAGLVFARPEKFVKIGLLWGFLQVLAMLLNPLTGSYYVEALLKAADENPQLIVPAELRDFLLGMDPAARRSFLEQAFSPQSFAAYLFNIPGFVARLVSEIIVVVSGFLALKSK
ncbi:MAG TPA: hypothetical protein EYH45_04725 [Candidatus Caldiarchaeum subterraneum]|uniref:Uncharacterized protein n=1 Tax=Caldiarchaeum subterraneum TaxID=311458 RepID=A0A832ZYT9_CALS0|nr:hypothetical protein [Candidatus Caldarchaeum subterraneum]